MLATIVPWRLDGGVADGGGVHDEAGAVEVGGEGQEHAGG